MRILVIGRSGQLAQSLARVGPTRGVALSLAGRPEVDMGDAGSLGRSIAAMQPDVVINAAAYTAVDKAESEREVAFAINAGGPGALAAATAAAGVPLIHVSTDYVFDGSKSAPYLETDPTGPVNAYGASKLEGERGVAAHNPRHVIVRTAWVVSPFGANFVKTMLRLAAERDELRVVADQVGSPTYAIDLADWLISIAEQVVALPEGDRAWGVTNLANTGAASWAEVAEVALAASVAYGRRRVPVRAITTAEYPTPARRPANSLLDLARSKALFGLRPSTWQDAIGRCVEELCAGR
jgi:dTDP-4-dehydrorhamnose reductase